MSVKRYTLVIHVPAVEADGALDYERVAGMHPVPDGSTDADCGRGIWVLAADYAALEARLADAEALCESLQNKWASRPIDYPNGEALADERDALLTEVESKDRTLMRHFRFREITAERVGKLIWWAREGRIIDVRDDLEHWLSAMNMRLTKAGSSVAPIKEGA